MTVTSLLDRPMYGMSQVDRLLSLRSGTAVRWIDGYTRNGHQYPPIVRPLRTCSLIATWGEFVETRLLSEYRNLGVPMTRLREVVQRLRTELQLDYPLANIKPFVIGRELVAAVQDEVDLEPELRLVVLRTRQYVLTPSAQQFYDAVDWDPDSGTATSFAPSKKTPRVEINPLIAFGEPAVEAVRTSTVAEEYRAGETIDGISRSYGLAVEEVEDALRFEQLVQSAA